MTLDCAKLCEGAWARPLQLEVWDWDRDGGHDFIGGCSTSLEALIQGEEFQIVQVIYLLDVMNIVALIIDVKMFQLDLINPKKKEKKGYESSGQIIVKAVKLEQDSTFLDYIRGGLRINLAVAVDLSGGGAADPASGDSLHRLEARTGENVYTTAIRTVGDILQDYDYGQPLEVNQQSVGIEYESMM